MSDFNHIDKEISGNVAETLDEYSRYFMGECAHERLITGTTLHHKSRQRLVACEINFRLHSCNLEKIPFANTIYETDLVRCRLDSCLYTDCEFRDASMHFLIAKACAFKKTSILHEHIWFGMFLGGLMDHCLVEDTELYCCRFESMSFLKTNFNRCTFTNVTFTNIPQAFVNFHNCRFNHCHFDIPKKTREQMRFYKCRIK